jgi:CheY-like chemotaxis protein
MTEDLDIGSPRPSPHVSHSDRAEHAMMSRNLCSLALELSETLREEDKQPRVLVVDARPAVRAQMGRELHRLGCGTLEARTPLETIHLLEWGRVLVHAVAIGPSLTQTRAEELASFLTDAYPDLPVVIVEGIAPSGGRDLEHGLWGAVRRIRDPYAGLSEAPAAG